MNKFTFIAFAVLLTTAACSDESNSELSSSSSNQASANTSSGSGGEGGMATMATNGVTSSNATSAAGGTDPGDYPAGPYGDQLGDTFPLLTWQGHHNPAADQLASNTPYLDVFTSQDMRQSAQPYALVHTAALF